MTVAEWVQLASNVVVGLIAVFGSVYVVFQVREARKSRLLGPYFEMDRRLHDQREDRRALYSSSTQQDDEWRKIFERVAVTFDVLGALVREDMIYRPIVFKIYYDVIIKTWDATKAHILTERNNGRKAKTYMADFEYLFDQSQQYAKTEGLDYPRATNPKDE
jgi:hypothetical protein